MDLPISTVVRNYCARQGKNDDEGNSKTTRFATPTTGPECKDPRGRVASQEGPPVSVGPQCTLLGPPHIAGSIPSFLATLGIALMGPGVTWTASGRIMGAWLPPPDFKGQDFLAEQQVWDLSPKEKWVQAENHHRGGATRTLGVQPLPGKAVGAELLPQCVQKAGLPPTPLCL